MRTRSGEIDWSVAIFASCLISTRFMNWKALNIIADMHQTYVNQSIHASASFRSEQSKALLERFVECNFSPAWQINKTGAYALNSMQLNQNNKLSLRLHRTQQGIIWKCLNGCHLMMRLQAKWLVLWTNMETNFKMVLWLHQFYFSCLFVHFFPLKIATTVHTICVGVELLNLQTPQISQYHTG